MNIKPFDKVKVGDEARAFGDPDEDVMTVIAVGIYDDLRHFDSTGACDYLEDDEDKEMVAVSFEGANYLYVYGEHGAYVLEPPPVRITMEQVKEFLREADAGEFEDVVGFMRDLAEEVTRDSDDPAWKRAFQNLRSAYNCVQQRSGN